MDKILRKYADTPDQKKKHKIIKEFTNTVENVLKRKFEQNPMKNLVNRAIYSYAKSLYSG